MPIAQLVILGASGDLTGRKLVPALVRLRAAGVLPAGLQVVGVSRSPKTSAEWRDELTPWIPASLGEAWSQFSEQLSWFQADVSSPDPIRRLRAHLDARAVEAGADPTHTGRLFYLALAPSLFVPTTEALASGGLLAADPDTPTGWRRLVVEKPFGVDRTSAEALNRALLRHLREEQIFRIDHYLGKETVQNILSLRFQNAIFEPLWNRNHVQSVEISVCETVAMEGRRGTYYDQAGALRDMLQNHVLQILALVAMEPPGSLGADAIRNEKVKILDALRPLAPHELPSHVVRGQYEGYRESPGVAPYSQTETFVAVRALVDTWRWSGVPFLLRTGKALTRRFTEVVLNFHTPPLDLLDGPHRSDTCPLRPNRLRLLIQPQEGVRLSFLVKQPGAGMVMRPSELGFDYSELGMGPTPDAYERLLLDALEGNPTLFLRGDEVIAAWRFVDTIRAGWTQHPIPLHPYAPGTMGPSAADGLFRGCEGSWSTGR